uniref:Uncharacterized protein n=1 Tax=Trichogramma kaykai TaxID=54128 RepID=A0ABD2XQY2_9HYME
MERRRMIDGNRSWLLSLLASCLVAALLCSTSVQAFVYISTTELCDNDDEKMKKKINYTESTVRTEFASRNNQLFVWIRSYVHINKSHYLARA